MENLWTPWRNSYVGGGRQVEGSIFEALAAEENDEANFILVRGDHAFALLNLFPYNTGHLMIVPFRRVADLEQLTPSEWADMGVLLRLLTRALKVTLKPDGLNIGMNVGVAAGAGIPDHLHLHVVPRWSGDTNFMPVLGSTKVLPELLADTYRRLRTALEADPSHEVSAARLEDPLTVPTVGAATVGITTAANDERRTEGDYTDQSALVVAALGASLVGANVVDLAKQSGESVDHVEAVSAEDESAVEAVAGVGAGAALQNALDQNVATEGGEPLAGDGAMPETDQAQVADVTPDEGARPGSEPADDQELPVVLQAGAVVLVRDKVALRLAKDQSWVLPKGHIELGETPEQAAVREVIEEMGLEGRLGVRIDQDRFIFKGKQRVVTYFLLHADRRLPSWAEHFGRDTFLFAPRDALARLSHEGSRAILARGIELAQLK